MTPTIIALAALAATGYLLGATLAIRGRRLAAAITLLACVPPLPILAFIAGRT